MNINYLKDLTIIFLAAAAFLAMSWIGFYGYDDWEYSEAANQWLSKGLFLGETHWALRHLHVLPIAASYALFGFGEFQLLLPTVIYFLLLLFVVYHFLNQVAGRKVALISCLVLISTPIMVLTTTMTRPDITEAFLVILSIFLFWRAAQDPAPARTLFFSGLAAGLGWITRETTVSLLVVYSLLFLAGHRYARKHYWIMAGGFASVLVLDCGYSMLMSGDPLYRYKTVIASAVAALPEKTGNPSTLFGIGETASSAGGNISVHWSIDPFLAILLNEEFGLTFWIAIPIGVWLCFGHNVDRHHRELARLLSLLALVWFLIVSYGLGLREQPRYFTIPAIAAVMLIGIGMTRYGHLVSQKLRISLMGLLIAVNFLGFYVDDENHLYSERAAIRLAEETSEPIYTDPKTAFRATRLIHIKRIPAMVRGLPPPPGSIYLYVPCNVCKGEYQKNQKNQLSAEIARSGWTQIWHDDPGRKISGILIEKAGLRRFIPESIYYKLDYPSQPVTAYRVPGVEGSKPAATN